MKLPPEAKADKLVDAIPPKLAAVFTKLGLL